MTYTNIKDNKPKSLKVSKPVDQLNLIVKGQGVVIFNATEECELKLTTDDFTQGLKIVFKNDSIVVNMEPSNEPLIDQKNSRGLVKSNGAYYWFSLDSHNLILSAGIGEARKETLIYSYQFPDDANRKTNKLFLESLGKVLTSNNLQVTRLIRDPITSTVPLYVKNTDCLTMDDIASSVYMPVPNLSLTQQKLYDCISGKKFQLNTDDFPDFTRAIEYSIKTPGLWCYEKLKQKATEFSKDKPNYEETYLRITLGENNGESPGIPYVMEIWPVGHYSPIHNHAGASAVIRVLHGSINVSLFPYLSEDNVLPFGKADFKKEDVTWISPTLNQVHQLKNLENNKDTCITIQCYMYDIENLDHYNYFDYIDADKNKQQYDPDSDMDFLSFKKQMKLEWKNRKWCC
jgi:hypothetical protein